MHSFGHVCNELNLWCFQIERHWMFLFYYLKKQKNTVLRMKAKLDKKNIIFQKFSYIRNIIISNSINLNLICKNIFRTRPAVKKKTSLQLFDLPIIINMTKKVWIHFLKRRYIKKNLKKVLQ